MKKIIVALAAVALIFTAAPAHAKASDYSTKQKNRYWSAVSAMSKDARIIGKKSVIGMGVAVCDLLRAGGTLYDLADLVLEADPIVEDVLMVSIAAAPVYLCRDQQYKFD